jgi:hypothetical protein
MQVQARFVRKAARSAVKPGQSGKAECNASWKPPNQTSCIGDQFRALCLADAFLCAILSLTFLSGDDAGNPDDQELNFELAAVFRTLQLLLQVLLLDGSE